MMQASNEKTGAIICKKQVGDSDFYEYEALMFITDIPTEVTDAALEKMISLKSMDFTGNECHEILIRADINSTSNEIWEQYAGLNRDKNIAPVISYPGLY